MKSLRYVLMVLSMVLLSGNAALAQWISQVSNLPGTGRIYTLSVVNEDTAWAMGIGPFFTAAYQGYSITYDGGSTWTGGSIAGVPNLSNAGIYAHSGRTAWMVMYDGSGTTGGGIFRTIDGGLSWNQQASAFPDPGSYPNFVHFFDADAGICMGDPQNGFFEIYTTSDGGENWGHVLDANMPAALADEAGFASMYNYSGESTLWFGSSGGRIFRTTDRGATWEAFDAGLGAIQVQPAFQDESTGLAVGLLTTSMAKTTDGGETWTPLSAPPRGGSVNYVPGTNATYITCSASSSPLGSAYTLDGGETWTVVDATDHGPPFFASSAVGWTGNFFNSTIYKWAGPVLPLNETPFALPKEYSLSQNYPNPFNPGTTIEFTVPQGGFVSLKIYNTLGEEVATVVSEILAAGSHTFDWQADGLKSGVYFYTLQVDQGYTQTRKMVLVR